MKSYMGSSRGHFEGNTLVVRTTNLNGKTGMQGNGMMLIPSDSLVLEERFTPIAANVLQYEVTIDDPKTWTAPWKVSFPLKREQDYRSSSTRVTRATTPCATRSPARAPTRKK